MPIIWAILDLFDQFLIAFTVALLENQIDGFPNPNSMFQAPNLYFLLALYWKEGKF